MNIFFTFDYELFLGNLSGSPERCVIRPTEALMRIAATHGVRFVFFVDSGYLARLAADRVRHPALGRGIRRSASTDRYAQTEQA